ncbi:MAG: TrkA family potassium uptake protein [Dehalococcoidia bacterium]|nr:TrkA family potassium uptake protein [Dehalococcoidia bacterium]
MKKQIAVIGLGRFGISLAKTLTNLGHEVLAIDMDEKKIQDISADITHAVQADATSELVLKELSIRSFDIAVVAIGSAIESSVLCTLLLKKLGVPYVIARADTELHGSILQKIGADTVIYPEQEMGTRLAQVVTISNVSDYMSVTPGYGVAKLRAPDSLAGHKLSELGFGPKGKWEVMVVLIKRENEIIVNPGRGEVVNPGDILIVVGNDDKVEKLVAEANKGAS